MTQPATLSLVRIDQIPKVGRRKNRTSGVHQAIALRELMASMALDKNLKPAINAACARVWCLINEEIRKLKMKPLPGQLDARERIAKRGRGKAPQVIEPSFTEPADSDAADTAA